ncbi:hypothetical protein HDC90_001155 [Pedobacter sp. AK013]|nr:hypothetical protein [Pedobacter sp. AK013]
MTAKERLKFIVEHTEMSYNSLAKHIGMKRSQALYDIRDEKIKSISLETASLINRAFPEIDINWMRTGTGVAIIPARNYTEKHQIEGELNIPFNFMAQILSLINPKDRATLRVTPGYNQQLETDKVSSLSAKQITPDILVLNGPLNDCDLVIKQSDPAIHGYIEPKSFIGLKRIEEAKYRKMIVPGKLYVIVMEDYNVERFVFNGIKKDFLLRSANPDKHPDFEISFDDIVEMWLVKAWVRSFEVETV